MLFRENCSQKSPRFAPQSTVAWGTLAIDDFGTGYSSFGYLRPFQVSKLKIDRLFTRGVDVNPHDATITTAVIRMAKSLNVKVVGRRRRKRSANVIFAGA
jgi:EAL domain-containing protein (putative c-di-GMP-specific phosphodiesterase class I)